MALKQHESRESRAVKKHLLSQKESDTKWVYIMVVNGG